MKLLVTGGAGFIGSHFVDYVFEKLGQSAQVVVLDALTYAGNLGNLSNVDGYPGFVFIQGDISDPHDVSRAMRGITHVVNFAAESHVDRSILDPSLFIRTNIVGTHTLLEEALKHGVQKFLQVSTDEVYGSIPSGSWDENAPLLPNSPYAASKASADLLVRSYINTYGLNANISRCSNNYGPRQFPEKIIPLFLSLLADDKPVPVYGNGMNSRDWLHVKDHCAALWLILNKGEAGHIYNVGGGIELTNIELVNILLANLKKGDKKYINFVEDRKGHDLRYSVDWRKIRSQLGYEPKIDFQKGLLETISSLLLSKNEGI
jgi:dTDP-glucose 4,6-dehydratase